MNNKGFTLIELLVTVAIIGIMTAMAFANYRFGDRELELQRSADKLAQDLRRAQELAISAKEFEGTTPNGYGIYFDLDDAKHYILFADSNGDQIYSGVSEKVEQITIEGSVFLTALSPKDLSSSLTVIFLPPDPVTVFLPDAQAAIITLNAASALSLAPRSVMVNEIGLITSQTAGEEEIDACDSDIECDDASPYTIDTCERPSDPDSVCLHDPFCPMSSASCASPDDSLTCGAVLAGCLNDGDAKYYSVTGSSGRNTTVSVTYSGAVDCCTDDLYIYRDSCSVLATINNTDCTKIWTGTPTSDIRVRLDGDSSDDNCQWSLSVTCAGP